MTTIAGSWAERRIVADTKASDGDVKWSAPKIERIDGSLYGCAGNCTDIEKFLRWRRNQGRKPRIGMEFRAIELNVAGLWLWDGGLAAFKPGCDFVAIGSGAKAAFAANKMGADAQKAVEVACEVDDASELPIQVETL